MEKKLYKTPKSKSIEVCRTDIICDSPGMWSLSMDDTPVNAEDARVNERRDWGDLDDMLSF